MQTTRKPYEDRPIQLPSGTATTDSSGNYTFTGLDNGSYTITPGRTG